MTMSYTGAPEDQRLYWADKVEPEPEEEIDEDDRCELMEGEDRCPNPATMSVFEPYTPASFELRCCAECGEGQIQMGYRRTR